MKYETYRDRRGKWRWRLKADNGKIIAVSSESYQNRKDCLHGIEIVWASRGAPVKTTKG